MNPDTWKWIVAFALGSAIGWGLRRGLAYLMGESGSSISASTVVFSSILGGFCGTAIAWVMENPSLSNDTQKLMMFGILGVMATVAADAAAAQAYITPEQATRLRRRLGVHVAIGAAAAMIAIVLVGWMIR
jgi:fluoride ion exporter CrcB/FEX